MMPLCLANPGEEVLIMKILGTQEVRRHLEDMGFTVGSPITLVNVVGNNVIVKVKDTRFAISESLARNILV